MGRLGRPRAFSASDVYASANPLELTMYGAHDVA